MYFMGSGDGLESCAREVNGVAQTRLTAPSAARQKEEVRKFIAEKSLCLYLRRAEESTTANLGIRM
jgi:hypothetical protein